ncbi:trifunctional serine/threonine-protein kinase/ATP-binding protein/sensor histidine kinase [Argonema galeatum]|uniref:trifunctional serine/threonine-protein kinase/ATP-binding protein/sensor histidine kinase n=1 Tax=Argonema galeatum TaxID=2942762 RepID=UPI002013B8E0|nr:ATP-binding sensor histidine kinase [Argonema galeatum]MCL1463298.1 AAA family ATPase [Argonema galeatum A003/A1]
MVGIANYQLLEKIYEGSRTLVYRGISTTQAKPVIVKLLKAEYPSFTELVRFRNQYIITKNLNIPGVVQPLSLENYRNSFALVMADDGSIALSDYRRNEPLSLNEFFPIAIQIAQMLEGLYINRVIHKDIKPQNILIHPETKEVKLIDFSIASLLPRETQTIQNFNVLEGTLAYMSPEQTGRMNRGLDYRTDFYSLGVTFYELLTGQLPFSSNDPLEIVHSHIAKEPISPARLNPQIPPAISEITLKLMAKNAEDRYQTPQGFKADLEICYHLLQTTGKITNFITGQLDRAGQLLIPQKLYGREAEVNQLLTAFARVGHGNSETILVSGYSGIGKTSVINEVHKPIVKQRGYFIAGKFDQFKRNIPYAALIQAFGSLMQQLLTESAVKILNWKDKLLAAVGNNGQVIINVIPEVELIIGSQPEVPQLGPAEAQNRFNRVFQEFISVFPQKEHPLVIFLDDLQWADLASLNLMQLLIANAASQYLLLIGAYRDNEVSPTHPLIQSIAEIEKAGRVVNNIIVQPLDFDRVNQLIVETLDTGDRSETLAELIFNKTGGNPFFITQLLQALFQEKLLRFDLVNATWQWNLDKIQAIGIADKSVVELVASRIEKLPETTQQILKLAACIGDRFTLDVLSIVNDRPHSNTANELWPALQAGLILPLSEDYKIPLVFDQENEVNLLFDKSKVGYKFLHDRVQQAAYSLIHENEKQLTHFHIGQLLLKHTPEAQQLEKIFDLVNQLNYGVDLISEQIDRDKLAQLNLMAGCKAKAATAYATALKYLTVGRELLATDSWQTDYNLTLNLYLEATEAAYFSTDFEQMTQLAETVLKCATTLLDKMKVYEVKILASAAQTRLKESVNMGLQILQLLGVTFPERPTLADIQQGLAETSANLQQRNIEDLIALPAMTDPQKLAAMPILSSIAPSTFKTTPELYPLIVFAQVNLSIKYGNSHLSPFAYVGYGLILCGVVQDIESGYQFGKLANRLLSQLNVQELKAKISAVDCGYIRHWKDHLKLTLENLRSGYQSGLETGDLEFTAYCAFFECCHSYYMGKELEETENKMATYSQAIKQLKQQIPFYWNEMYRQSILNLLARSPNLCYLQGEACDEEQLLPILTQANDRLGLHIFYSNKLILGYLFEKYALALENANIAVQYLDGVTGMFAIPIFHFYDSLVQLALGINGVKSEQDVLLDRVIANQEKLKKWADYAPMNYLHKFHLVEAERLRVVGADFEAMEYYDLAIEGATANEYIQEEAIACELAGKFYESLHKEFIAQAYLTKAYYAYARWGAKAKVDDLETRYPQLLAPILTATKTTSKISQTLTYIKTNTVSSTSWETSVIFDLGTVLKASQNLSDEIELDKLLTTVMQVVLENAGATSGSLILPESEQWYIAATINADSRLKQPVWALLSSITVEDSQLIPEKIVNYVKHTKKTLVIDDVAAATTWTDDYYIQLHKPQSILCATLLNQGELIGILYLENCLTKAAFTRERLEVLKVLCSQAAIALKNARLYQDLQRSEAREREKAEQLAKSLQELQSAQLQLIQSEKMSVLGNLMAGLAHEINNPVGFIAGNVEQANTALQDLLEYLQLYQEKFPNPGEEITEKAEEIELEYILEDLPQMLSSMKAGTDRIREIGGSLRNFSRADTSTKVLANLHEGIDSTLMILQYRLKAKDTRPAIEVIKEYGEIPQIKCYFGQLNQVFMNILGNAIDALDEANQGRSFAEIAANPNQITIRTEVLEAETAVVIRIKDNGSGMSDEVKEQVFDHLFTTKAVGKGTGLGLSISRQIVEEKHGGKLSCISAPEEGTEFAIQIPI